MSPKYKLVYFNLRARGELIRLLFHAAGVQFEDHRVEFSEWPALKPKTPDGTLPYLSIDGKEFGESMPLARYVARKYNLAGKTDQDQLVAEIILNYIDDIRNAIARARNDKIFTDAQKLSAIVAVTLLTELAYMNQVPIRADETTTPPVKEIEDRVLGEQFPKLLMKLEKKLSENKSGFLVGDGVTIADLAIVDLVDTPIRNAPNVLEKFPKLCEHRKRIQSLPKIAKYLASRPDTEL